MVTERGAAGPAKPPPDVTGLPEDVRTVLGEHGTEPGNKHDSGPSPARSTPRT